MSENVLEEVKANSLFPDDLMADISRSTLGRTLVISIVVHVILLGVTSIGFIGLCLKYDTLYPKRVIAAERVEAKKKAILAADKASVPAAGNAAAAPLPAAGGTTAPPSPAAAGATPTTTEKSPIEQTLEEVDRNLPKKSNVTFDKVDSLE